MDKHPSKYQALKNNGSSKYRDTYKATLIHDL